MRLFREPDAGNPPVRFDEREEETELRQTGLRRRGESPVNRHREATVTAPLLDSTHNRLVMSVIASLQQLGTIKQSEVSPIVWVNFRRPNSDSSLSYQPTGD